MVEQLDLGEKHSVCCIRLQEAKAWISQEGKKFLEVASYLEDKDDEQITTNNRINQKLADTNFEAYGYMHMKTKLQEHFGERIVQTKINGKPDVITFSTTARVEQQDYYSKWYNRRKQNTVKEKMRNLYRLLQGRHQSY